MTFQQVKQIRGEQAYGPADSVVHPNAIASVVQPAAALEIGEVARDRGLGQFQHCHQVADTQLSLCLEQDEYAQADRIGKAFECLGELLHRECV